MSLTRQKVLRRLGFGARGAAVLVAAAAAWFYRQLHRSLPQLDGTAPVTGLTAPVTIGRDALGVPALQGATRLDLARALGWLHAQERFFQMDLLRRRGAGELAALLGAKAVPADKASRRHGFRRLAHESFGRLPADEQALLQAYAAGVNAGLAALPQKPFEYLVLRAQPAPWQPEDSALVAFAMALELNDEGNNELSLTTLRNVYGPEAVAFLAPIATVSDAALDGSLPAAPPPLPSARDLNVRGAPAEKPAASTEEPPRPGSNSFALAGAHTASGVPLLASDMHLHLRVPNIWYRASLAWADHRVTGVTLPGVPVVIAGSNGHVAWGLTNAYADTGDIVVVEPSAIAETLYRDGDQLRDLETRREVIAVKGGDPVTFDVDWTVWGPVIGKGEKNRPLVYHWTVQEPRGINLALIGLETARTTAEGIGIAHIASLPAQNILIADAQGHIAWTVVGGLPRRVGYDGRFASSWAYGDRLWSGYLSAAAVPVIRDPADGRLWTANNRLVGDDALARLGDGGYDHPARGARIRDRLQMLENATPQDLLAIQLDDAAPRLDRWRDLALQILTPELAAKGRRAAFRAQLATWDARARPDSVSYRLVKLFRQEVASLVFDPLYAPCLRVYPDFNWHRFHYEQPLWTLLQERPQHFLPARHADWDALLLAAVDRVIKELDAQDTAIADATWGRRNRAAIVHPFSYFLPGWMSGWLNLPADELPGDSITPRVQRPDFGASERFVVSPGREDEGIFHMPGGQSGHPLSPYYRAGHEAWFKGEPTPFLPGPAVHTLTLEP
ncbi:MAG: penicillin acylase family protein [Cephaloticoccus sp.]